MTECRAAERQQGADDVAVCSLVQGQVPLLQLELLMGAARITAEGVRAALVDHLVYGHGKSASAKRNRIRPNQVARALKSLTEMNGVFAKLAPFYVTQAPGGEGGS